MLRRRRWTDLSVEGVVIVVSILLAFALDAWWNSRGQRQEETQVEVATLDLARTFIAPTFDPRTGSLDGPLSSGRLGILRNEDLRRRLSSWPGLLADPVGQRLFPAREPRSTGRLLYPPPDPGTRGRPATIGSRGDRPHPG